MTPQDMILGLDAALVDAGSPARLVRVTGTATFTVDCQIILRGYDATEIIAGADITAQDQRFTLSPTPLIAYGWPGPATPVRSTNPLVPRNGDRIVANGAGSTIQAAAGVYVQGVLVRIDGRTRGDT